MDKATIEKLGIRTADILLPKKDVDYSKWAVIACDQFTSQEDYWRECESFVGQAESTLKIIYPEVYLEKDSKEEKEKRIESINSTMEKYVKSSLFDEYKNSFILVKRTCSAIVRWGLVCALDLEKYDYSSSSSSLIRATEGTINERIPPRKEIRKNAILESPHIMVLISDEKKTVIERLRDKCDKLKKLYDFDLMQGGGHIEGYLVDDEEDIDAVYSALNVLYDENGGKVLYLMGDGNHSLATAKSIYEDMKEKNEDTGLTRYALVEIENIFDDGICFEPIHRLFFNISLPCLLSELSYVAKTVELKRCESLEDAEKEIEDGKLSFAICTGSAFFKATLSGCTSTLSARVIQNLIDRIKDKVKVDYIHGSKTAASLAGDENIAIILPQVRKEEFFSTVLKDGSFPRKTFSIGHAEEKRYYLESRIIKKI
ncbi:MAG TPA: DUF1015 domain-containing protein [Candidatus Ornithospirochaeta avicola]|uniref:DUF1015 domain-containing protein n=1 Tax=Candidatus Ornithospirochaeta avicola TaxID=2840896 RepID=A0A9D1PTU7_9SPIO|nr:DUF1015 domain-containing protein [Candidatus Ornithospirochaeta avicola]